MRKSRREVLRFGGSALAVALAGCPGGSDGTATDSGDGGSTDGDSPAASETATGQGSAADLPTTDMATADTATSNAGPATGSLPSADYAAWLPATGPQSSGYWFESSAPGAVVELADSLGDGAADTYDGTAAVPGIDTWADTTAYHDYAGVAFAVETPTDRSTIEDACRSEGFDEADTHRDYTVFTGDGHVVAVGDAGVAMTHDIVADGPNDDDGRSYVESVVDARTGHADRCAGANPDCDRLIDALGTGHVLNARTDAAGASFDGAVAAGVVYDLGPAESTVRTPVVFREGETDEVGVADWASVAPPFFGHEATTTTDGRVVTAEATVPTGDITGFSPQLPKPVPEDASEPYPETASSTAAR